jgi:hypothetical protein
MDPKPALTSCPKSDANVENEKAVPMTRNSSQNTAATTIDAEVVENTGSRMLHDRFSTWPFTEGSGAAGLAENTILSLFMAYSLLPRVT